MSRCVRKEIKMSYNKTLSVVYKRHRFTDGKCEGCGTKKTQLPWKMTLLPAEIAQGNKKVKLRK